EWATQSTTASHDTVVDIAIVRLPRVANLDEFQPLMREPGVRVRWIGSAAELGTPDLIILPGTKATLANLSWLRERALDEAIRRRRASGTPILGICGGFQMLGTDLVDDHGTDGGGRTEGLRLLPVQTTFAAEKLTRRVSARLTSTSALWSTEQMTGWI